MNDQHRIDKVTDTLKFSEDQFGRFLVDFAAWWAMCKMAQGLGAEVTGFVWIDDDIQGEIHSVECTDPKTGEKLVLEGPVFVSDPTEER